MTQRPTDSAAATRAGEQSGGRRCSEAGSHFSFLALVHGLRGVFPLLDQSKYIMNFTYRILVIVKQDHSHRGVTWFGPHSLSPAHKPQHLAAAGCVRASSNVKPRGSLGITRLIYFLFLILLTACVFIYSFVLFSV